MSALEPRALGMPQPKPGERAERVTARSRRFPAVHSLTRSETLIVFSVSTLAFFLLGLWILHLHVVYADAESRLAHAYMAWWNDPSKLSAIGFIWPPVQTLVLIPLALIKPLATSLIALPLMSSLFAGAMVTVMNRTLTLFSLGRGWRYGLLLCFVANPLFLDFATNGMAEIVFMALMAAGMHYFASWYLGGADSYRKLSLSGLWMGFAFMSRYEIGAWIALMAGAIVLSQWPRRRRWSDVEAPVLVFLAPTVYMAAVWSVISMMIIGGGPLTWLTRAGDQGNVGIQLHESSTGLLVSTLSTTADVSPALWAAPIALVLLWLIRRDKVALMLAIAVVVGAGTTAVLLLHTPAAGLLHPRYNIRALGPMLLGCGWLVRSARPGHWRWLVGSLMIATLIAAVPFGTYLMRTESHGQERAYIKALLTAKDQNGTIAPPNFEIGTAGDERFAHWIDRHVHRRKSVLMDDAAFPGVVLLSGRPVLFRMLVDFGTARWRADLDVPWGHFSYMMVGNPKSIGSGFASDFASLRYPQAYAGHLPGTRVVMRDRWAALLWVAPLEPVSIALNRTVYTVDHGGRFTGLTQAPLGAIRPVLARPFPDAAGTERHV